MLDFVESFLFGVFFSSFLSFLYKWYRYIHKFTAAKVGLFWIIYASTRFIKCHIIGGHIDIDIDKISLGVLHTHTHMYGRWLYQVKHKHINACRLQVYHPESQAHPARAVRLQYKDWPHHTRTRIPLQGDKKRTRIMWPRGDPKQ